MNRIAVIDDDADMLRMVTRMLRAGGYECFPFANVEAAMAALDHTEVDLILTDVFMPGMDAFDVLNLARIKFPAVPVIAMSGGGQFLKVDMLPDAKTFGAAAAISKPFSQAELLALVDDILQAA